MISRRAWLAAAGGFVLLGDARGQAKLEQGIRNRSGEVRVSGERITTGADGQVVIVIGRDAMLVRRNSTINILADGFRLATGAVLSVFSPGRSRQLSTPTSTIGIRGTAVYLEAQRGRTYVCTCYGEAVLASAADPNARETVRTKRHEQPRYVMAKSSTQMLMQAPMTNHTDAELEMLEKLLRP